MLKIGCHLSVSKGYEHMGREALSIEANTFQFFTRNPRGSKAKKVDPEDAAALMTLMQEHEFAPILGHAPYTLNPCSADAKVREFALMVMEDDLKNLEYVPGNLYVFHPGSHVGQGIEVGIGYIVTQLNQVLWPEQTTVALLETMSGKGSEVGSTFEEIKTILDQVELRDKIGVCLDTCHIYSAGYDIVNNLEMVLEEFDNVVGLEYLKAIHLNDSMNPFNSRKDRHAKIGEGTIGFEAIARIVNHPQLRELPFFLETPNEVPGYGEEIKQLRDAFKG